MIQSHTKQPTASAWQTVHRQNYGTAEERKARTLGQHKNAGKREKQDMDLTITAIATDATEPVHTPTKSPHGHRRHLRAPQHPAHYTRQTRRRHVARLRRRPPYHPHRQQHLQPQRLVHHRPHAGMVTYPQTRERTPGQQRQHVIE